MRAGWMRVAAVVALAAASTGTSAHAIHWYRGPGGGCAPKDGALTDDPQGTTQNVAATVVMGHNIFAEGVSGFGVAELLAPPVTTIKVGESIRWTWNSAHCHSVTSRGFVEGSTSDRLFESGFYYPATAPDSPHLVDEAFAYPLLDEDPSLSYTRTFTTPGTFEYFCVHHDSIGMNGTVVVEA